MFWGNPLWPHLDFYLMCVGASLSHCCHLSLFTCVFDPFIHSCQLRKGLAECPAGFLSACNRPFWNCSHQGRLAQATLQTEGFASFRERFKCSPVIPGFTVFKEDVVHLSCFLYSSTWHAFIWLSAIKDDWKKKGYKWIVRVNSSNYCGHWVSKQAEGRFLSVSLYGCIFAFQMKSKQVGRKCISYLKFIIAVCSKANKANKHFLHWRTGCHVRESYCHLEIHSS